MPSSSSVVLPSVELSSESEYSVSSSALPVSVSLDIPDVASSPSWPAKSGPANAASASLNLSAWLEYASVLVDAPSSSPPLVEARESIDSRLSLPWASSSRARTEVWITEAAWTHIARSWALSVEYWACHCNCPGEAAGAGGTSTGELSMRTG